MGGEDGYYVTLIHELLHATGHPRRLGRPTTGDYSDDGTEAEERTINTALRIVLAEIGFPQDALDWHIRGEFAPRLDKEAAERAADWFLNGFAGPQRLTKGRVC
jgi:antirestriction protein ArdC